MHRRVLGIGALACGVAGSLLTASSVYASQSQPAIVSDIPASTTPHAVDDGAVPNASVQTFSQVGSVMYAGGKFRTVRNPARTVSYSRYNLFSFSTSSGAVTSWTPRVNGPVLRTVAAGGYLYVGGSFTSADGVSGRLVRYSLSTLRIDAKWRPTVINGAVSDLEVVGSRLFVSGSFSKRLVALNLTNGGDTDYLKVSIAGRVASNSGLSQVYRFAVNPARTRLVGIGNFTSVGSAARSRAFMLDLGSSGASLNRWYYAPLAKMCSLPKMPAYLRDVDFAPDGSYFVMVSTGRYSFTADRGSTVCDAAARFETYAAAPSRPTWINYTGGDTLLSVAAVGTAVYVGGHQRWMNNPLGKNSCGAGCVSREGVAALDSRTGKVLSWNPGKTRGVGTSFIYPTSTGIWWASDGLRFRGVVRESIAFTPLR